MRHLQSTIHPELDHLDDKIIFQRNAARAIVLDGEDVLLLYTERYHDYTLPGGGIDEGEDVIAGLVRELEEETGRKIFIASNHSAFLKSFVLGTKTMLT